MKQGCHVYVEKPLVRTVWEARRFAEVAKACGVMTQMGNNGNGSDHQRRNIEIVQSGVLGDIREIHVSTDRPIWPQAINRPEGSDPVPETLAWDCWRWAWRPCFFSCEGPVRRAGSRIDKPVMTAFSMVGYGKAFSVGPVAGIGMHEGRHETSG